MNIMTTIIAIVVSAILGLAGFMGMKAYQNSASISNFGSELTTVQNLMRTYTADNGGKYTDLAVVTTGDSAAKPYISEDFKQANADGTTAGTIVCDSVTYTGLTDQAGTALPVDTRAFCLNNIDGVFTLNVNATDSRKYDFVLYLKPDAANTQNFKIEKKVTSMANGNTVTDGTAGDGPITAEFN